MNHLKEGKERFKCQNGALAVAGSVMSITRAIAEKQFAAEEISLSSSLSQSGLACLRNLGEE